MLTHNVEQGGTCPSLILQLGRVERPGADLACFGQKEGTVVQAEWALRVT